MTIMSSLVDSVDWSGIHTALAIYGGLATVYVMKQNRYEAEDRKDTESVRISKEVSLAAIAGAMFWCVTYGSSRDWEPWPPEVLLILALDVMMTVRIIAVWHRIKRMGRYPEAVRSNIISDLNSRR